MATFSIFFLLSFFPPLKLVSPVFAIASVVPRTISTKTEWLNKSAIRSADKNPAFTTLFTLKIQNIIYAKNESDILYAKNLKLNIPQNATINGITVKMIKRVDRFLDGKREFPIADKNVNLILNGSVVGNNKASSTPYSNDKYQTFTYGSTTDNWGTSLTSADINSPEFGVAYSVARPVQGVIPQTLFVDQIEVLVDYSTIPVINPLQPILLMPVENGVVDNSVPVHFSWETQLTNVDYTLFLTGFDFNDAFLFNNSYTPITNYYDLLIPSGKYFWSVKACLPATNTCLSGSGAFNTTVPAPTPTPDPTPDPTPSPTPEITPTPTPTPIVTPTPSASPTPDPTATPTPPVDTTPTPPIDPPPSVTPTDNPPPP